MSNATRRVFLSAVGASFAGAVLRPRALRGAETPRKDLRFCVISDTHLGYRDEPAAAEQWKRTAAELADAPGEFVLHLGDIVDGGREAQYPLYTEIRKTIGKPVHEVPGNHDPQELFAKHVRQPIDTAVDYDWLRLLLLGNARPDSHDGFLSEQQLEWLGGQCRDAADQGKSLILCLHVPVHENKHPDRGWYVKPEHGQKAFYEIVKQHAQRIVAVFHGHFHNGLRGWDDHAPVHEVVFPSALYNQDRQLEQQSAPGYNLPEFRPGYTLAEIRGETLTLRYKPLGQDPAVQKQLGLTKQVG